MLRQCTYILMIATTAGLVGCTAFGGGPDTPAMQGSARVIVLDDDELNTDSPNLLATLKDRLPGMQVDHSGVCPDIMLRGRKSLLGSNSPAIYIDGNRTADTCILELLLPLDVQRVEVYPLGVASHPGYKTHPDGLILVFLRSGGN